MKTRTILLLFTALFLSSAMMAQEKMGRPENLEQFKAMKVAFITERVDLTSEEAEKLWPVYNEYEDKRAEMRDEGRKMHQDARRKGENITQEEARAYLAKQIELRKKEIALDLEYQEKFLEILTPKKVMQLGIADWQFKSFLLKQIRDHKGEGEGRRGRGREAPWPEFPD